MTMTKQSRRNGLLYRLDTAAMIYPAVAKKGWNNVFRISIDLKHRVDPDILRQAVCDAAPRFPTIYVRLFKGFLWDYLESAGSDDIVVYDSGMLCRPFDLGDRKKPLFRVLFCKNRISVEFFHALTDGSGAATYLKTITAVYLRLCGYDIEGGNGILDIEQVPTDAEMEDSFRRVYDKSKLCSRSEPNAYQYRAEYTQGQLSALICEVSIDALKQVTKRYDCTITEFLIAAYGYVFLQIKARDAGNATCKYPVRISAPANLRTLFGSTTLRNFAMMSNVDIEGETAPADFAQLLREAQPRMRRGWSRETLHALSNTNVRDARMLITQVAPRALKSPVIGFFGRLFGERKFTSTLSNIGLQKLPPSFAEHVERMVAVIGETAVNRVNCAVMGVGDKLSICFSSVVEGREVEDRFVACLEGFGVPVTLYRMD